MCVCVYHVKSTGKIIILIFLPLNILFQLIIIKKLMLPKWKIFLILGKKTYIGSYFFLGDPWVSGRTVIPNRLGLSCYEMCVCVCVYVYIYTYTIFFMLHGKVYTSNIDKRICVNGKDISFKVMISKLKTFRGILVDKL